MRPAAAPHNSVVALPDRGERSGGPLNAGGTGGGGGGLVLTRRWTLVVPELIDAAARRSQRMRCLGRIARARRAGVDTLWTPPPPSLRPQRRFPRPPWAFHRQ